MYEYETSQNEPDALRNPASQNIKQNSCLQRFFLCVGSHMRDISSLMCK